MTGAGFPYIKTIPDRMEIVYVETPRPLGAAMPSYAEISKTDQR
jgi:hypothetical protein